MTVFPLDRNRNFKRLSSLRWSRHILFILSVVFACGVYVSAQTSYCPQSVTVKQTIDKLPDGWSTLQDDSPNALATLTFFSGPPDQKQSLVYDKWVRESGLARAEWHFTKSTTIWLTCGYASTNIALARQLPSVTQCTVTYDPKVQVAGSPSIQKIDCQ
jgi:hypothetical protein